MTIEIPSFNNQLPQHRRAQIVADHLRQPIIELLTTMGPLTATELEYFLTRRYDMVILGGTTMGEAARDIVATGHIKTRPPTGNWDYNSVYYMPGDADRAPSLPLLYEGVEDHADAYIELYLRYQAIRNNPALATAPESLIDDLYNPSAPTRV